MDFNRPSLIASDGGDSAANNMVNGVDRKAIAYLLRYETMVRQQEAEQLATLGHLRPLFDSVSEKSFRQPAEDIDLEQDISLRHLSAVLEHLEDVDTESYMQTDRQLVMVLETLTQKGEEGSITWAEFLQCYKTVISGMQTLQNVSAPKLRARCKDRTLNMISLFQPPATKLLDESVEITFEAKRQTSTDKRAAFALIGAIIGAAVGVASTPYLTPQPTVEEPMSKRESKRAAAIAVSEKSPIFSPSLSPDKYESRSTYSTMPLRTKPQPLETRKKLAPPPMLAKKAVTQHQQAAHNLQTTGVTAAVGGVTGMLVAPVVWTAMQQIPAALAGLSAGGLGVVTLAGAVLLQGVFHSVGSIFKALRGKNKKN